MSSSIELLSLHELNIRRDNLIKLLKNTNHEIEKRKKEQLDVSKFIVGVFHKLHPGQSLQESFEENTFEKDSLKKNSSKLSTDLNLEQVAQESSKIPKKQIKIKINISKSNK
jgi:hypothetical protein